MDAIKLILIILFFIPFLIFGQKSIYPKDTIYVKFENKAGAKKWNAKFERIYEKKNGIYFNVENSNGDMALFYDKNEKPDTLCIMHLKNYKFTNLKEINEKRHKWIFDNKRPPADRNGVFQTYLIEIISKSKFVKYPVIWRNEGAID